MSFHWEAISCLQAMHIVPVYQWRTGSNTGPGKWWLPAHPCTLSSACMRKSVRTVRGVVQVLYINQSTSKRLSSSLLAAIMPMSFSESTLVQISRSTYVSINDCRCLAVRRLRYFVLTFSIFENDLSQATVGQCQNYFVCEVKVYVWLWE